MTTYITDAKAFKAACASISKRGAKLDADIQHAALSAANAMLLNKNPMYVNMLYLALHSGARKSVMTEWLLKYAGVMANEEKNKKEMPFKYDPERTVNLAAGAAQPWFDCKPDQDPDEVFDIAKAVAAIIKKAQGKAHDPLMLARLENFASSLTNEADPLAV